MHIKKVTYASDGETFDERERRRKPRLDVPIQVRVRLMEGSPPCAEFDAVALNISAGGICAQAPRPIKAGCGLYLTIRFALAGSTPARAPTAVTGGVVLRAQQWRDGRSLFAAAFTVPWFI